MTAFNVPPVMMYEPHKRFSKTCIAATVQDFEESLKLAQKLTSENKIVFLHFWVPFETENDLAYQMQLERIDCCDELYLVNYRQGNYFIDKQIQYANWQGKRIFQHYSKMTFSV
jgi:hypothetical protein